MKIRPGLLSAVLVFVCAAGIVCPAAAGSDAADAEEIVIEEEAVEAAEEEVILEEDLAADLREEEEPEEPEFFTLYFDFNDGSGTVLEQRVHIGEVTQEPEEPPAREGWLFEGWFNDGVVGRRFSFGEPLYADQTLYAHWSTDDWKIDRWFPQVVRGGSNIAYDAGTHSLNFGAGELILTRQNGGGLEDGYYLGYRITAPQSVTENGELYEIEIGGVRQDFNGPQGICSGVDETTGCLYLDVYERIDPDEIMKLADRNAPNFPMPSSPGNRENLVIEEAETGRRGRGESSAGEEEAVLPELKTWEYRITRAGSEDETLTLTATLDPRFLQFRDGTDLEFFINWYRYRYRVRFDLDGGTGDGDYAAKVVKFGEQVAEPDEPWKEGFQFLGWYPWNSSGQYWTSDQPYPFTDRLGVRSSVTLRAKWAETVEDMPIIRTANVQFEGQIRLRIQFEIPDELMGEDSEDRKVVFCNELGNRTEVLFTDAVQVPDSERNYYFYCPVPIPEFAVPLTISIEGEDGPIRFKSVRDGVETLYDSYPYTLQTYIDHKRTGDPVSALVRAMETYGQAASNRFLDSSYVLDLGHVSLDEVTATATDGRKPAGLQKVAQNVNFESDNALNIKFTFSVGENPDNFSFTVPEGAVKKTEGQLVTFTVPNIAAPNLSNRHTFSVSDGTDTFTVETSPMAYAKSIAGKAGSTQEDVNLMKALYEYHLAALDYFQ